MSMQITSSNKRGRAFTLTEVLMSVAVLGVMLVSLYLAFSAGFTEIRVARENLRATQVLVQRAETLRLYTWTQLNDPAYFKTNFTENSVASPRAKDNVNPRSSIGGSGV